MNGEQHVPVPVDLEAIEAVTLGVSEFDWTIWHDLDHQGFKTVGDAESYDEVRAGGEAAEANPIAHVYAPGDAVYIAYMDPRTTLSLVDEVRRLREVRALPSRQTIAAMSGEHGYSNWEEDNYASGWNHAIAAVLALIGQEGQR